MVVLSHSDEETLMQEVKHLPTKGAKTQANKPK